ncbi:unnamed protein product, partial [Adineta ricciae]
MPKFPKQRSFNRYLNLRRSIESISIENSSNLLDEEEDQIVPENSDPTNYVDFSSASILNEITDLFTFCKEQINTRFISVLLYISLRYYGHSWREISSFLDTISAMTAKTAHKWSTVLVTQDFDEFISDRRGGKHNESVYDIFPELELEAKQYVFEQCTKKEASFTAEKLAKFIDDRFYDITQLQKVHSQLVRSIESCRLDLRRFGAKHKPNAERPYFLGHERNDVVQHRQQFIEYFMKNQNHFYTITND